MSNPIVNNIGGYRGSADQMNAIYSQESLEEVHLKILLGKDYNKVVNSKFFKLVRYY